MVYVNIATRKMDELAATPLWCKEGIYQYKLQFRSLLISAPQIRISELNPGGDHKNPNIFQVNNVN